MTVVDRRRLCSLSVWSSSRRARARARVVILWQCHRKRKEDHFRQRPKGWCEKKSGRLTDRSDRSGDFVRSLLYGQAVKILCPCPNQAWEQANGILAPFPAVLFNERRTFLLRLAESTDFFGPFGQERALLALCLQYRGVRCGVLCRKKTFWLLVFFCGYGLAGRDMTLTHRVGEKKKKKKSTKKRHAQREGWRGRRERDRERAQEE